MKVRREVAQLTTFRFVRLNRFEKPVPARHGDSQLAYRGEDKLGAKAC